MRKFIVSAILFTTLLFMPSVRNHHICLYPPCKSLPSIITPFNMPTSRQHRSKNQVDRRDESQRRRRASRTATLTHRRKTRFIRVQIIYVDAPSTIATRLRRPNQRACRLQRRADIISSAKRSANITVDIAQTCEHCVWRVLVQR